jgi:hypothetical protein
MRPLARADAATRDRAQRIPPDFSNGAALMPVTSLLSAISRAFDITGAVKEGDNFLRFRSAIRHLGQTLIHARNPDAKAAPIFP